ncbi:MAG TPA: helix-turn-helix domain-containing protein [Paracoccaceae bacterium]|nr:helix-turn-helix domain-containing protein [Paracoccaceae bacterium]HMO73151.1 helix-turn-helix domain-containing protein [Paracoccaceae bacterium]
MAVTALTGARIRAQRERLGMRQADLARRAGISGSYLNLIEHDRRRVGGDLLARLAGALGVSGAVLAEGDGGGLVEEMRAAAAAMAVQGPGPAVELDRAEEFVGRLPGWAALVASQARRIAQLERLAEALNDRIGHDPHLSAALHEVLNAAASVRSTAAILAEGDEVPPAWRATFTANLATDSDRLAAGAEALVAYLDAAEGDAAALGASAHDELADWLASRGWHLPELEPGGTGVRAMAAGVAQLAAATARALARDWLATAARDAAAMPLAQVTAARAAPGGDDPVRIAAQFGVGPVAAMRRLAMLPGAAEGLVICDASGAVTFRKPVAGFPMPRGDGAACPLWPLYAALGRPMQPVVALVELPGPPLRRFRARAFCEPAFPAGAAGPELRTAAMLLEPMPAGAPPAEDVLAVGGACRICPRDACPARREPAVLTAAGAASAARIGQAGG